MKKIRKFKAMNKHKEMVSLDDVDANVADATSTHPKKACSTKPMTLVRFCDGSEFDGRTQDFSLLQSVFQLDEEDPENDTCRIILCTCGGKTTCDNKTKTSGIVLILPIPLSDDEMDMFKACLKIQGDTKRTSSSSGAVDFMKIRHTFDYLGAVETVVSSLKQVIIHFSQNPTPICLMSGYVAFPSCVHAIDHGKYTSVRDIAIQSSDGHWTERERVNFAMATDGHHVMLSRPAPARLDLIEMLSLPREIMELFDGSGCVIAGGAAMAMARGEANLQPSSDIDIFVFDLPGATELIEQCITILRNSEYAIYKNVKSNSVLTALGHHGKRIIQVILADALDGNDLIAKFDLYAVQVFYDGTFFHYTAAAAGAWSTNTVIGGPAMLTIKPRRLVKMLLRGFTLSAEARQHLEMTMTPVEIAAVETKDTFGQPFIPSEPLPAETVAHLLLETFSLVKHGESMLNPLGKFDNSCDSDAYGRKLTCVAINMKAPQWHVHAIANLKLGHVKTIHEEAEIRLFSPNTGYALRFGRCRFPFFQDYLHNNNSDQPNEHLSGSNLKLNLLEESDNVNLFKYNAAVKSKFNIQSTDESHLNKWVWVDDNTTWLKHGFPVDIKNIKDVKVGMQTTLQLQSILVVPRFINSDNTQIKFTAVTCVLMN